MTTQIKNHEDLVKYVHDMIREREPDFYDEVMNGATYFGSSVIRHPDSWDDGWNILAHFLRKHKKLSQNNASTIFEDGKNNLDYIAPQTFEQAQKELYEIELQLAKKLNLPTLLISENLLELDLAGELVEDELVSRWHEVYSRYKNW